MSFQPGIDRDDPGEILAPVKIVKFTKISAGILDLIKILRFYRSFYRILKFSFKISQHLCRFLVRHHLLLSVLISPDGTSPRVLR